MGHHFAAIAGAGPLVGPVLAAQFGYFPGFLWLLLGVIIAGAVQDFIIFAASVRHDGKSLAEIARAEISPVSGVVASVAILFIVIVALAGLGIVVVNALAESLLGNVRHRHDHTDRHFHGTLDVQIQKRTRPLKPQSSAFYF